MKYAGGKVRILRKNAGCENKLSRNLGKKQFGILYELLELQTNFINSTQEEYSTYNFHQLI